MFYLKKPTGDIPIYGDEIFTRCTDCNKEMQFDESDLAKIIDKNFDFAGTNVICEECSTKTNPQKRTGKLVFLNSKTFLNVKK